MTGDILPKVYGGFGTSLTFKGFDFSIAFAYQLGGRILDYTYQSLNGVLLHKVQFMARRHVKCMDSRK